MVEAHQQEIGEQEQGVAAIGEALQWGRTSIMGLAWLGNLAFATIDMLMLGILSGPEQVGLYSACLSHPQPGADDLLSVDQCAVSATGEADRGRTVANVAPPHSSWRCLPRAAR